MWFTITARFPQKCGSLDTFSAYIVHRNFRALEQTFQRSVNEMCNCILFCYTLKLQKKYMLLVHGIHTRIENECFFSKEFYLFYDYQRNHQNYLFLSIFMEISVNSILFAAYPE